MKNVYKRQTIVFYDSDKELYDIVKAEAEKKRTSLRAIILNLLEQEYNNHKCDNKLEMNPKETDVFADFDD